MVPDASSRASRTDLGRERGHDHLLDAAALHHYRTRSSGDRRGTTVKTVEPRRGADCTFAQISARTVRNCSQLPKLMAPGRNAAALGAVAPQPNPPCTGSARLASWGVALGRHGRDERAETRPDGTATAICTVVEVDEAEAHVSLLLPDVRACRRLRNRSNRAGGEAGSGG